MSSERIFHTLDPVFDENSKVLILGTIPSPKSREARFYYSHPQNRFWAVLSTVLDEECPATPIGRKELVLRREIALWDVLASCDIVGASDASIKNPVPNDIAGIIKLSKISTVFTTGVAATNLYCKFCLPSTGIKPVSLPSTSPANARMKVDELISHYRIIADVLRQN